MRHEFCGAGVDVARAVRGCAIAVGWLLAGRLGGCVPAWSEQGGWRPGGRSRFGVDAYRRVRWGSLSGIASAATEEVCNRRLGWRHEEMPDTFGSGRRRSIVDAGCSPNRSTRAACGAHHARSVHRGRSPHHTPRAHRARSPDLRAQCGSTRATRASHPRRAPQACDSSNSRRNADTPARSSRQARRPARAMPLPNIKLPLQFVPATSLNAEPQRPSRKETAT